MSPNTCSQALRGQASLSCQHYLPVVLIADLSLTRVVQHSPVHLFQFHAFAYTVQFISVPELSLRLHAIQDACMRMMTITLRIQNSTLPFTEMKHTSIHIIYVHIKLLPVSRVFGACSGSPRILYICEWIWEKGPFRAKREFLALFKLSPHKHYRSLRLLAWFIADQQSNVRESG